MRTALYARISSDRTGEGLGVTRQQEDCEKLCADRGWEIVEVYVDNDTSAYSGKPRPNYERMLADIAAGEIDALVAWHPDRLHRSPRELETFIDIVEKHATAIATVRSGDLDLATASGRMTARIVGSVARHESEQKSERIKRALEQNAMAGKRHGAVRPFGFEQDGVTIYEPEAALIRDAAERVLAGETVTGIARAWNADGVPTPQRKAAWHPTKVRGVLVAPRITGLRSHNGEVVGEAVWDAVLDRPTWERLVGHLARTTRTGRPATYLLSKMARCGRCTGPLWGSRSSTRTRYTCASGPGRDGCGGISIAAGQLDTFVGEAVMALLTEDGGRGLTQARQRQAGDDQRQAAAWADLAEAEKRKTELAGDYADGAIDRGEWFTARERVEARITAAQKALDRGGDGVLGKLPGDPDELQALWTERADDISWRRAVVGSVVERVVIHPATTRGPNLDEGRVEIVWR